MDQIENHNEDEFFKKIRAKIKVVKAEDMRLPSDDDPFFKKKLEEAVQALKENPLPEHLVKRLERD